MAIEFEDQDYDLAYCEGDPTLDDVNIEELLRLTELQAEILSHPREEHQDLASVGLLSEMYGDELDVR